MIPAIAYGYEAAFSRRCGLVIVIISPADDVAIIAQATGVASTSAYGYESLMVRRSGRTITPADGNTIRSQSACSSRATVRRYSNEAFLFWRQAPIDIVLAAPAEGCTVVTEAANVTETSIY